MTVKVELFVESTPDDAVFILGAAPESMNTVLWLDAADTSTITASSGAVSQWDDKSSGARHFTQSTAGSRPTTGVTTLNGRNVIDFDNDWMGAATASDWTFLSDGTDYIVATAIRIAANANPGVNYPLLSNHNGVAGSGGVMRWFWDDRASQSRNNVLVHHVGTQSNTFDSVNNVTASNTVDAETWLVLSMIANPDSATASLRSQMWVNAGTVTATNARTTAPTANTPPRALRLGNDPLISSDLVGSVAELVIVSGADATEANRLLLVDHLRAKWGI